MEDITLKLLTHNFSKLSVATLKILFITILLLSIVLIVHNVNASDNWLDGWEYRKFHVINKTVGAEENYQIKIVVINGSGSDNLDIVYINNKTNNDFGDIRFTAVDGITLLYQYVETLNVGINATFWVNVSGNLSLSSQTIFMYYGNPYASSLSSGESTFLFFDDFNDNSFNTTKWNSLGTITESNGLLGVLSGQTISKVFQIDDGIIEFRGKATTSGNLEVSSFARSSVNSGNAFSTAGTQDYWSTGFGSWENALGLGDSKLVNNATGGVIVINTFYYYRFICNGETFKGERYLDGGFDTLQVTQSYTASGGYTSGFIGLRTYSSRQAYYDWVRVRKYVYPEPLQTIWGAEEMLEILEYATTDFVFFLFIIGILCMLGLILIKR